MSDEFPLAVSKADVYYIYPFVLDFQLLRHPRKRRDYLLKIWSSKRFKWINKLQKLQKYFPLNKGLPKSRLGFTPLLPYQALVEEFGHFEKPERDKEGNEVLLPVEMETGEGKSIEGSKNITANETFVIKECGNGALTYKLHIKDRESSGNTVNLLGSVIRLVPRIGDEKFRKQESHIGGDIFDNKKKRLFRHVRKDLFDLERLLRVGFGKKSAAEGKQEGEHIWEDREVLYVKDEDRPWMLDKPSIQPFAFIVLYLKGDKYNYETFRNLLVYLREGEEKGKKVDEGKMTEIEDMARALFSIIYRFQDINNYWMTPYKGTHLLNVNRILTINNYMACFFHHTSVVAVIDDSEKDDEAIKGSRIKGRNFVQEYFVPAILNAVENAVSRTHFAYILDGLLDKQIKEISTASFDELPLYSQKLAKAKSQTAMFLQNIGQYIKGGNLGSEILTMLDEVLRINGLEEKLEKKLNLTTQVFNDTLHFKYSKDIYNLKKKLK